MRMKMKVKRCSQVYDRLGEEIWSSILSLLPLQEAVRTSVLSKSWRNAWKTIPELHLGIFQTTLWRMNGEEEDGDACGWLPSEDDVDAWVKTVDAILDSHTGPIQTCYIPMHYVYDDSDVDRWIQVLTTRRSIQNLEIESREDCLYEVPVETLFSCETLKEVRLRYCAVRGLPPDLALRCKNLGSLELYETAVDAQTLGRLLSQSPILESLTLSGCEFRGGEACTGTARLLHIIAPNLKRLDINFSGSDMSTRARIDAPRLKSLNLSCWLHMQKLEVFAPELERVYCSTPKRVAEEEEGQRKVKNLLRSINHAKIIVREPAPPNFNFF